jgi:hypothetical protein
MPNNKLWFSLYTRKEYESTEPPFVYVNYMKGVSELEQHYEIILKELEQYLEKNNLTNHFNNMMVEKPKTWKVQGLGAWGRKNYSKQIYFPKTMTLLSAIPNVTNISFNLLEPQSKIKPHQGDTNAIIRCHLGLKIPANPPICQLKVKGEIKGWQPGKIIAFNDAYTHEACNLSNEPRIILLFDILKPQFIKQKSKICATVCSSMFVQKIGNIWPGIYNINREIFKPILFPCVLFMQIKIPVVNTYKYVRYIKLSSLLPQKI